jgi:O-methyltransferase involved in polyketide biosynthesis
LISPGPHSKHVAKSIFDYSWFEDVEFDEQRGVLILAAGLFNYFQEDQLKDLCSKLADHFTGGILIFDIPSVLLKRIVNRKYKRLGCQGADQVFGLGDPKVILKWSNKINAMSCTIFFKGLDLNPQWHKKTRFLMKLFRTLKFYKLVKLEFK